jgi:hypothetical protein
MRRLLGIGLAALLAATGCSNAPPTPGGGTTRPTYDKNTGRLTQLTFDRNHNGVVDTWTEMNGSRPVRSRAENRPLGVLSGRPARAGRFEEDTNGDSRPDTWETYEGGVLKTTSFDENGDGRPDRRLTYEDGELTLIESEPDAAGNYQKKVAVK